MTRGSAHEKLLPIRVSQELVGSIVGQTIYCAWFRIDQVDEHTYEMTVSQDAGDIVLNHLAGDAS